MLKKARSVACLAQVIHFFSTKLGNSNGGFW
ncbi:hypothetical protein DFP76_103192 [Marinomonas aquiplantarum]|uniref:Uncharacterized protein n=1 Tax=Marinomonas aquiplantarum TaxID=491951 RepID=A0A366D3R2_9GAMM|nr:hypothetical protein DFP76_103192 [Marinomonas aquiplantarum]